MGAFFSHCSAFSGTLAIFRHPWPTLTTFCQFRPFFTIFGCFCLLSAILSCLGHFFCFSAFLTHFWFFDIFVLFWSFLTQNLSCETDWKITQNSLENGASGITSFGTGHEIATHQKPNPTLGENEIPALAPGI